MHLSKPFTRKDQCRNGTLQQSLSVTVSNILGKVVKQVVLNTVAANYVVDLNDLEDGIYMVNVRNEFGEKTQRVVLKK
ncbi:MAG: T9SS type A sorting domain-containing protein [Bacteroidetes bacterium]|nr:T9SS type A sorting domain-containing protein [Bacteroidota bacterium]